MSRHAFLVAGTHSGSGKTTITLGLMAALMKRGYSVMPFKCGPDFIDPSLHRLVTGKVSRNLDLWMAGETFTLDCFNRHSAEADVSVIEGVMGMFDGGESSSGTLASRLDIPVILILDVRSAAESGAAVLKGFECYDPAVQPSGVILNMVGSERHFSLVKSGIEKHCHSEILGYIPRTLEFNLPSRHLGLHMGEEQPISQEALAALTRVIDDQIDLDRLMELSRLKVAGKKDHDKHTVPDGVRIGVARDRAFCFYYQDNLDILEMMGAELVYFSPLEDSHLPPDLAGLYLGGGYPELYGERLSVNEGMLAEIRHWAENDGPIYAECGGFMYLTRGIHDLDGNFHQLVGLFPTQATMQTKRASLGYRELTTRSPSFFGPAGTRLRGHEFHYSRIEQLDDSIERIYDIGETTEGYRYKNVIGGYMHLHFGFNGNAVQEFIHFCKG